MQNLLSCSIRSCQLICIVSLLTLGACATRQPVHLVTEYAVVPATFQQVPAIPPVPKRGEITVGEGVALANRLRIAVCTYRSRYRELLRYATQGKVVLSKPTNQECPK